MSCLQCQHCNCNCGFQTKTEVILYPNSTYTSARQTYELRGKSYRVNRNSKQQKRQRNELEEISTIKSQMKKSDTMETFSKILSVPSCQIIKPKNLLIDIKQSKWKQEEDSLGQPQDKNKENNKYIINQNCAQSRLQIINQSQRFTLRNEKKNKINDSYIHKFKSNFMIDSNMISSHSRGFLSPHSSNVTQKSLTIILLQRQNSQLRIQFQRLKQKQKELLNEQQKLKDKNNRQLGHLKKKSMELQLRSSTRKRQLEQLQGLLKIVRGQKQSLIKQTKLKNNEKIFQGAKNPNP